VTHDQISSEIIDADLDVTPLSLTFRQSDNPLSIVVYPNPAEDVASITIDGINVGVSAELSLYTTSGQMIYRSKRSLKDHRETWIIRRKDLGISSGLHYLTIQTDQDIVRRSIVFVD